MDPRHGINRPFELGFLPKPGATASSTSKHKSASVFSMKSRFARQAGGNRNVLWPKIQATRFGWLLTAELLGCVQDPIFFWASEGFRAFPPRSLYRSRSESGPSPGSLAWFPAQTQTADRGTGEDLPTVCRHYATAFAPKPPGFL
jgi:hypothetical protein